VHTFPSVYEKLAGSAPALVGELVALAVMVGGNSEQKSAYFRACVAWVGGAAVAGAMTGWGDIIGFIGGCGGASLSVAWHYMVCSTVPFSAVRSDLFRSHR
jgi:hypothetical protein